jgi:hypothetical protein
MAFERYGKKLRERKRFVVGDKCYIEVSSCRLVIFYFYVGKESGIQVKAF